MVLTVFVSATELRATIAAARFHRASRFNPRDQPGRTGVRSRDLRRVSTARPPPQGFDELLIPELRMPVHPNDHYTSHPHLCRRTTGCAGRDSINDSPRNAITMRKVVYLSGTERRRAVLAEIAARTTKWCVSNPDMPGCNSHADTVACRRPITGAGRVGAVIPLRGKTGGTQEDRRRPSAIGQSV